MYRAFKSEMATSSSDDFTKDAMSSLFVQCVESKRCSELLSAEDVSILLTPKDSCETYEMKDGILGYPGDALYVQLAAVFFQWAQTGQCPVNDLPSQNLLDEQSYVAERLLRIDAISPQLQDLESSWKELTGDERLEKMLSVLLQLGRRGLLDLLGLRKTAGSIDVWPPPRCRLEETFNAKHKPNSASMLSVGARALAKHCHRDESSSWWGKSSGTEAAKNKHSQDILARILDHATWINIHQMVHEQKILEVRQEDGYGARWTADGIQFRGFLEPQMVDGHDVGWRH
eukprot:GHVO01070994.1.p1 GENE.GHVO01070994.1~~GHVO01070994.1.p1  ORF type:complete len:287 (+),score=30.78 GHVO01070994.1:267-1127(+)